MSKQKSHQAITDRLDLQEKEAFLSTVFRDAGGDPFQYLLLFSGAAYAACGMNAWCFSSKDGQVLNAFAVHEKELATFFIIGKCLDYMQEHPGHPFPFLLSDGLGMLWIAEFEPAPKDPECPLIFVLGPVFSSMTSPAVIRDNLDKLGVSLSIRRQLETVLSEVPVLSVAATEQYARMLHFILTGQPCTTDRFLLQKAKVEIDLFDEHDAEQSLMKRYHAPLERVLERESRLLSLVREGRPDDAALESLRSGDHRPLYVSGDPLRNAKDELIILNTKYIRASEDGGLPPQISRSLSLRYLELIEKAGSLTELADIERSMTEDYISQVHALKEETDRSKEVLIVEHYIRSNLTKPLRISDAARLVGYTEYYLSRKFAKETGLKFADYVNRERVLYAQTLLRTTQLPIQEISALLQFSSISYFGRVFKSCAGVSPTEYRNAR